MEEGLKLDSLDLVRCTTCYPERCFTIHNSMYVVMTPNDSPCVFRRISARPNALATKIWYWKKRRALVSEGL